MLVVVNKKIPVISINWKRTWNMNGNIYSELMHAGVLVTPPNPSRQKLGP